MATQMNYHRCVNVYVNMTLDFDQLEHDLEFSVWRGIAISFVKLYFLID